MVYSNHSTARLRPLDNTSFSGGFPRLMEAWTRQTTMATFLLSITSRLIDFQNSYFKIIYHRNSKKRPNGLRLSRLAGCAGLGSSILRFPQRTYQRKLQPKANSVPTACWAVFVFYIYLHYYYQNKYRTQIINLLIYIHPFSFALLK